MPASSACVCASMTYIVGAPWMPARACWGYVCRRCGLVWAPSSFAFASLPCPRSRLPVVHLCGLPPPCFPLKYRAAAPLPRTVIVWEETTPLTAGMASRQAQRPGGVGEYELPTYLPTYTGLSTTHVVSGCCTSSPPPSIPQQQLAGVHWIPRPCQLFHHLCMGSHDRFPRFQ